MYHVHGVLAFIAVTKTHTPVIAATQTTVSEYDIGVKPTRLTNIQNVQLDRLLFEAFNDRIHLSAILFRNSLATSRDLRLTSREQVSA